MDIIIDTAATLGIERGGIEAAILVAAAYLVVRWLWLGIRADLIRWGDRRKRRRGASGEHAAAFDRGMQRLLADLETRREPELTAYRRAA